MNKTPWGPVGYITYKRTYARRLSEKIDSKTEEFVQSVQRVVDACNDQLHVGFTEQEKQEIADIMLGLEGSVAGRFLWQLGTATVDKLGLLSLQNCALTVIDHPIRPFTWAMDALMLGSGVGYNLQREYVYELPRPKKVKIVRLDKNDADFIVPDSREGWVELLHRVLEAHFITGKGFSYSTVCVRGKGSLIRGFGGVAAGPEELCWGMEKINKVLNDRSNKKVRPIDCLDIMNIIGYIVVAGNVRRSAQIAIGDMDDLQFLNAKRWDLGNIPSWRAMSNNSVVCNDFSKLPDQFWQGYYGNGEPYGLINLQLSRTVGRAGDEKYSDPLVVGYNPSLRKGTKIWTSKGIFPIESLQNTEFVVKNLNGNQSKAKCWLSGKDKSLYKITLKNGFFYYCTAEHKWPIYTPQGYVKTETTDLKPGHLLPIVQSSSLDFGTAGTREDGFAVGWLYGDGWVTKRGDNDKTQYGWIVSNKDMEYGIHLKIIDFLERVTGKKHKGSKTEAGLEFNSANAKLHKFLISFGVGHKREGLPSEIWSNCSEDFRKGFIDGFYSSDGTIECLYKTAAIVIAQSNEKLISDLSELLGFYGIKNGYRHLHIKSASFPNKVNYTREYDRYTLKIANRHSMAHFRQLFNLSRTDKQLKLANISLVGGRPIRPKHHEIISVELTDLKEDVWDISVNDLTHCFQLSHVITGNCGEQSLWSKETCCLAEIFLPNIASYERFLVVAKYLYRICKHSLRLSCHLPETEEIVHKNMRMGIGITGYLQATEEQRSWLSKAYEVLREYDKQYSALHHFPESIKITTVKPSGTLSLLAGVTPGAHPGFSQHGIRRIRIAANSPLVEQCREKGYPVEFQKNFDHSEDRNTVVVSFPFKFPEGTKLAKDMTAIDQLETIKRLQSEWSDNAVSCTIYYKVEELAAIQDWLKENYDSNIKAVSFLLHKEHGFIQAPLEELTQEQYTEMFNSCQPFEEELTIKESDVTLDAECSSGFCPIK